jgi:hypothetical protein
VAGAVRTELTTRRPRSRVGTRSLSAAKPSAPGIGESGARDSGRRLDAPRTHLAFRVGFVVGNYHWTIYGTILALLGVAQLICGNTRQRMP